MRNFTYSLNPEKKFGVFLCQLKTYADICHAKSFLILQRQWMLPEVSGFFYVHFHKIYGGFAPCVHCNGVREPL